MAARRSYTDEEVDAAVAVLSDPERLKHAQEVMTHAAPALQRVLNQALHEGGWFAGAHESHLASVTQEPDFEQRLLAVRTLVAEEARLGMLVGATIGFELAHELMRQHDKETD